MYSAETWIWSIRKILGESGRIEFLLRSFLLVDQTSKTGDGKGNWPSCSIAQAWGTSSPDPSHFRRRLKKQSTSSIFPVRSIMSLIWFSTRPISHGRLSTQEQASNTTLRPKSQQWIRHHKRILTAWTNFTSPNQYNFYEDHTTLTPSHVMSCRAIPYSNACVQLS